MTVCTYETLADVTEYVLQGNWLGVTDAKSGCHHITMQLACPVLPSTDTTCACSAHDA